MLPPLPSWSVPPLIVVVPLYVFEPIRVSVPEPVCVRLPLPLMTGKNVTASAWLKRRLPLSNRLAVLPIDAPLPPLPTCSVPAEIVVPPL